MNLSLLSVPLLCLLLLQSCSSQFEGNAFRYDVINAEGQKFKQTFIQEDSLGYSNRLKGNEIIEEEWLLGDTSIIARKTLQGPEYTVLSPRFNKFRRLRQYSHITVSEQKPKLKKGIVSSSLKLNREDGEIHVLTDERGKNVIADLPDIEFLALKIDWSLVNRNEIWELESAIYDQVPPIVMDSAAKYIFPEVWLVDPRLGTPQNDNYKIDFDVSDFETTQALNDFQIEVTRNDSLYAIVQADASHKSIFLPLGHTYSIKLNSTGYLGKSIWMDMTQIPPEDAEGGFLSELNFVLFKDQAGFDESILEQPIGKASYNLDIHAFEWDFEYTSSRQELINQSLQAH